MKRTLLVVAAITAALVPAQLSTAKASGPAIDRASAPTASLYRNCKALNRVYPAWRRQVRSSRSHERHAGHELPAQQQALPP